MVFSGFNLTYPFRFRIINVSSSTYSARHRGRLFHLALNMIATDALCIWRERHKGNQHCHFNSVVLTIFTLVFLIKFKCVEQIGWVLYLSWNNRKIPQCRILLVLLIWSAVKSTGVLNMVDKKQRIYFPLYSVYNGGSRLHCSAQNKPMLRNLRSG